MRFSESQYAVRRGTTGQEGTMNVQAGRPAPDFTAQAFHEGRQKEVKLSDYKGAWVMLCFYPADFTCV